MGFLTVRHWGLGLWIERPDYYEVLFPRAEGVAHPSKKGAFLEAHDPTLFVPRENCEDDEGFEPNLAFDLRGCTLDLRHLGVNVTDASFRPSFLIPLKREPGSVAEKALGSAGVASAKDDLIGRVLVPRGIVSPGAQLEGPIKFDGKTGLVTTSIVNVSAPLSSQHIAIITNELNTPATVATLKLVPDKVTGNIVLTLQNLSIADRQPGGKDRKPRSEDSDFAAHYRLTTKARKHPGDPLAVPIPRYEHAAKVPSAGKVGNGEPAPPAAAPLQFVDAAMLTYPPGHICTACWIDSTAATGNPAATRQDRTDVTSPKRRGSSRGSR